MSNKNLASVFRSIPPSFQKIKWLDLCREILRPVLQGGIFILIFSSLLISSYGQSPSPSAAAETTSSSMPSGYNPVSSVVEKPSPGAIEERKTDSVQRAACPKVDLDIYKGTSVLFIGTQNGTTPGSLHTWRDWRDMGFEIDVRALADIKSEKDLLPFDTVVINSLPDLDSSGNVSPDQIRFEQALDQYLKQGGDVVVLAGGGGWGLMSGAVRHLLEPYGASVPEEQIVDPEHILKWIGSKPFKINYTTQIAKAPMTRGISLLGYVGEADSTEAVKLMMPVVLKDPTDWHIVVRGEKTAYSAEAKRPGSSDKIKNTPASYSKFPVMAAWRNVGNGRLFVYPINPVIVASPEVFENYLWDKNDQNKLDAPQNRTFIMEVVGWAGEVAHQNPAFGGYKTNPNFNPDSFAVLNSKPEGSINWATVPSIEQVQATRKTSALKGLIGAESTYSGGPFTIAQLCQAARAAHLDFLGFTEKLEDLTPATWVKVEAECKSQSDDHFLALPGMRALDKPGNTWFSLGNTVFPKPPTLTPELKRLDNTYNFFAQNYGYGFVGFAKVDSNPNPWFEMKQVSAFSVATMENGKMIDFCPKEYLQSCYNAENYLPIFCSFVTSPQEIQVAANNLVNVFAGGSIKDLLAYAENPKEKRTFTQDYHPWYLSRGPILNYSVVLQPGGLGADEENENTFRYGFKLSGLESGDRILLMDGPTVFREWLATDTTFSTEHTWPKEQMRYFVVQVVRNNQVVLLTSATTVGEGSKFNQCGDRQNTIPYNYEPDDHSNYFVSGPPIGPHYKSWAPATLIYANVKIRLLGTVGLEWHPFLGRDWNNSPLIPFEGPRVGNLASYQFQRLSCPGIVIVDEITNRDYPNGGQHLGDCQPPKRTVPLKRFDMIQRRYGLYGMIGQLNGQLVDSRIKVLQDASLKKDDNFVVVSRDNLPSVAPVNAHLEVSLGGHVERYPIHGAQTKARQDKLSPGDYLGVYPSGLTMGGAQYEVAGDLYSDWETSPKSPRVEFKLKVPTQWKKGDEFKYDILYTTGGSLPNQSASDYEKIIDFLGFHGPFPSIKNLTGGSLETTPVIAMIQTDLGSTVRFSTPKNVDDPIALPIRLHGWNPNWQTVYTLNGSKHWRYFGELDGDFYFHLYTRLAGYTVVAGQPLSADEKDVHISLDDPLGKQSAFEIYNPTDKPMTVHLKTNSTFFPPKVLSVNLNPYESKNVRLD